MLGCCLDFVYFVGLAIVDVGCWRVDLVAGLPLWCVFVSLLLIVLLRWILLWWWIVLVFDLLCYDDEFSCGV